MFMLTQETIRILAKKHQTTELNTQREYVQHMILSYLYRQPDASRIFFKGGTALRVLYQSPRFSEDLDFDASERNMHTIEDLLIAALKEIEREGIGASVEESKKTSGGYLAILNFTVREKTVSVQIELSFRDKTITGELHTIVSDFVLPYTLMGLSQKNLIGEKIQALRSRKKPRDFYDLYFILRANLLRPAEKKVLVGLPAIVRKTSINFERELKQFLPITHWPVIRDFKSLLLRELDRYDSAQ